MGCAAFFKILWASYRARQTLISTCALCAVLIRCKCWCLHWISSRRVTLLLMLAGCVTVVSYWILLTNVINCCRGLRFIPRIQTAAFCTSTCFCQQDVKLHVVHVLEPMNAWRCTWCYYLLTLLYQCCLPAYTGMLLVVAVWCPLCAALWIKPFRYKTWWATYKCVKITQPYSKLLDTLLQKRQCSWVVLSTFFLRVPS